MKGNPAVPGGPLTSKPTWSNTSGCSTTSAFFRSRWRGTVATDRENAMDKSKSTMAQQIAQAAIAFEQQRTGNHVPKSVTVVLSEDTLVITLHEALSPAEKALAKTPAGAAQVQEFHRQLFANSSDSLRQEINTNHRHGSARGDRGSRAGDRRRGAGFHHRQRGPGVPARRQRSDGNLEWEWTGQSVMSAKVLQVGVARNSQESCFAERVSRVGRIWPVPLCNEE